VRRVSGSDEHGCSAGSVFRKLCQCVVGVGLPVAVTPDDGDGMAACCEFFLERGFQGDVLLIDGAFATKTVIVLSHFRETLVGDSFALCDIAQERNDVFRVVGATKGVQQDGIIWGEASHSPMVSLLSRSRRR